jgi:hypothetical protein
MTSSMEVSIMILSITILSTITLSIKKPHKNNIEHKGTQLKDNQQNNINIQHFDIQQNNIQYCGTQCKDTLQICRK